MFKGNTVHTVVLRFIVAIVLIFFTSINLHAKSFTTKPGKAVGLMPISQFDGDSCSAGTPPKYKITQTSHGKLKVVTQNIKLKKGPCKGRTIKFYILIYIPQRGFKGQDKGAISFSKLRYSDTTIRSNLSESIIINVK